MSHSIEEELYDKLGQGSCEAVDQIIKDNAWRLNINWAVGKMKLFPTLLHRAAVAKGCTHCVSLLLRLGASIDPRDEMAGSTPLACAAQRGHTKLVELLANHGADVDSADLIRRRPIHLAADAGFHDTVELLLRKGASVDCRSKDGYTPLHRAVMHCYVDVAELLLEKGASVDTRSRDRKTVLFYAVQSDGEEEEVLELVDLLFEYGASGHMNVAVEDIESKAFGAVTPLDLAIIGGRSEVAKLLIQHGGEICAIKNCGARSRYRKRAELLMKLVRQSHDSDLWTSTERDSESGRESVEHEQYDTRPQEHFEESIRQEETEIQQRLVRQQKRRQKRRERRKNRTKAKCLSAESESCLREGVEQDSFVKCTNADLYEKNSAQTSESEHSESPLSTVGWSTEELRRAERSWAWRGSMPLSDELDSILQSSASDGLVEEEELSRLVRDALQRAQISRRSKCPPTLVKPSFKLADSSSQSSSRLPEITPVLPASSGSSKPLVRTRSGSSASASGTLHSNTWIHDPPPRAEKQGFGPSCSLWIGWGLKPDAPITADSLRAAFSKYGRVGNVRLMEPNPYGFVEFMSVDEAGYAKSQMDGKVVCGVPLRVNFGKGIFLRDNTEGGGQWSKAPPANFFPKTSSEASSGDEAGSTGGVQTLVRPSNPSSPTHSLPFAAAAPELNPSSTGPVPMPPGPRHSPITVSSQASLLHFPMQASPPALALPSRGKSDVHASLPPPRLGHMVNSSSSLPAHVPCNSLVSVAHPTRPSFSFSTAPTLPSTAGIAAGSNPRGFYAAEAEIFGSHVPSDSHKPPGGTSYMVQHVASTPPRGPGSPWSGNSLFSYSVLSGMAERRQIEVNRVLPATDCQDVGKLDLGASEQLDSTWGSLCPRCCQRPIDAMLLECGHLVACVACSNDLKICPRCNAPVDHVFGTFLT